MEQNTIQFCPILKPNLSEFLNFRQYVQKLDKKYKKLHGMVKIVPPKNWIPRQKNYEQILQNLIVQGPIQQNIFGKGGIYQCLHIPKKSVTLEQYKIKAKELDKITDNMKGQQVQKMFWKNIAFSPPLYGADLVNTLMDKTSQGWDLNNLNSILKDALSQNVRGVNNPYCYVGSWKALFCWHTQDLDLSAINFLHLGKPKFWYAIHHEDRPYLQKQAQRIFPQHFSSCSQFLRHKTTLINPYLLKKKYPQIRIQKAMQEQNQFILVFGGSYHCGFNFGYNIAQAVNYATLDWLRQLPLAKSCKCSSKSVKASEYQIYKNLSKINAVSNTQQFKAYQAYIFRKAEQQQSQEQFQQAKKGVKDEYTKKIKKLKKAPRKIIYNNEQYEVQNWAQCQKCNVWRVIDKPLRLNQQFTCKKSGKQCFKREKIDKKIFTISTGSTKL